jgi:hypothetical protein
MRPTLTGTWAIANDLKRSLDLIVSTPLCASPVSHSHALAAVLIRLHLSHRWPDIHVASAGELVLLVRVLVNRILEVRMEILSNVVYRGRERILVEMND